MELNLYDYHIFNSKMTLAYIFKQLQMTKSIKIDLVSYAIKLALHYTLVTFLQWIFCKVFAIFYKNCLPWPDEKDLLQNFLGGKLLQLIAQ